MMYGYARVSAATARAPQRSWRKFRSLFYPSPTARFDATYNYLPDLPAE
jgi:hypothetical protein